jgi:DNA-directed RNA polymerase subunit RPC12/RpoP
MTAPSSFRERCPSCTKPVLIGNPGLVGRKIECPHCRHRFLLKGPDGFAVKGPPAASGIQKPPALAARPAPPVDDEEDEEEDEEWEDEEEDEDEENEDEDEEDEDDEEEEDEEDDEEEDEDDEDEDDEYEEDEEDDAGEDDEEDDEEDEEDEDEIEDEEDEEEDPVPARMSAFAPLPPTPPKKSVSKVLKVGVPLAVVAVAALGVGGFVLFRGRGTPTAPRPLADIAKPIDPKSRDAIVKPPDDPREQKAVPAADPGVLAADVSNLLPNDTETVLDLPIPRLLGPAFKQAAFATPNAFSANAFRKTFGFPIEDVRRIVTAGSRAGDWIFSVVRTAKPVNEETLVAHLRLVPGGKVGDLDYYVIRRPLDSLGNLLLKMNEPRSRLALHVMDSRTFIVADVAPMKKFLEDKRKPADFKPPVGEAPAPPTAAPVAPAPASPGAPVARTPGPPPAAVRPSDSFRTIAPALKAILDEMESAAKEGETVLVREAVSGSSAFGLLGLAAETFDQQWNAKGALVELVRKQVGSNPNAGGICLLALNETNLSVGLAAHLPSAVTALEAEKHMVAVLPPVFKGANLDLARDAGPAKPGAAVFPPAAIAGNQGKDGTWSAWSRGPLVALTLRVSLSDNDYRAVVGWLGERFANLRIWAETAERRPRVHELAEAIQAYVRDKGSFPRGALDRAETAAHPFPWRPDQRLSWLVDLLPYLPGGDYGALRLDRELGWNEGVNLVVGRMPVPHFLGRVHSTNPYWRWVAHWGQYWPLAASHYVGISGVGMDSADYRSDDPQTAAKLGIFGYDRVTRPADVKDGLANTIVAVQVPAEKARPWMAGGGSTVRAVSGEDDCLRPFVCLDYRGRRGTFALMADGKVRFLPADLPPATFRALCTIAGGETVQDLDRVAPVVEAEDADVSP